MFNVFKHAELARPSTGLQLAGRVSKFAVLGVQRDFLEPWLRFRVATRLETQRSKQFRVCLNRAFVDRAVARHAVRPVPVLGVIPPSRRIASRPRDAIVTRILPTGYAMIPRVELGKPGCQILWHLRPSNETASLPPVEPGSSHHGELPHVLPAHWIFIFTSYGSERPEPVIGTGQKSLDDQRKDVWPESYDPLIAWVHYALRKHRKMSRLGSPLVGILFKALPQIFPVNSFRSRSRFLFSFRSRFLFDAPPRLFPSGSRRNSVIMNVTVGQGDDPKWKILPGKLTHYLQNQLDVPRLHGGGFLDHHLYELVIIKIIEKNESRPLGSGRHHAKCSVPAP